MWKSPRGAVLGAIFALLVVEADGAEFFVAPDPRPGGVGSTQRPWGLVYALSHPPDVKPGDTIWLRGGTYRGKYVSYLTGTSSAPIVVRSYPGEWAKIDSGVGTPGMTEILSIAGSYSWFWGFEIMSSDPVRQSSEDGSWPSDINRGACIGTAAGSAIGTKLINLVCHDAAEGFELWQESSNLEAYGNIIYNNGWVGATDRGHGHAIYAQNATGSKVIGDNIILQSYDTNVQIYGSSAAPLQNFTVDGNIIYQAAKVAYGTEMRAQEVVFGGGQVAANARFTNNVVYTDPNNASYSDLGYTGGMRPATVTGNVVSSGYIAVKFVNTLDVLTMTGNTFRGLVVDANIRPVRRSRFPNNTFTNSSARPSGVIVMARPNRFEPGRGHVAVLNWDLKPFVEVDVSSILEPGASFEVRNAQDFFAPPVRSGVYAGGTLALPMTGLSVAAPIGATAPPATGPEFSAFVVITKPNPSGPRVAPDQPTGQAPPVPRPRR